MDPTATKPEQEKPDLTRPIARTGEEQFAVLVRNRSGQDAGEIDYTLRHCEKHLCDYDKRQLVDAAYMLYESVRDMCGYTSKLQGRPSDRVLPDTAGRIEGYLVASPEDI